VEISTTINLKEQDGQERTGVHVRSLLTLVQVGPSGEHRRQACGHGPPA